MEDLFFRKNTIYYFLSAFFFSLFLIAFNLFILSFAIPIEKLVWGVYITSILTVPPGTFIFYISFFSFVKRYFLNREAAFLRWHVFVNSAGSLIVLSGLYFEKFQPAVVISSYLIVNLALFAIFFKFQKFAVAKQRNRLLDIVEYCLPLFGITMVLLMGFLSFKPININMTVIAALFGSAAVVLFLIFRIRTPGTHWIMDGVYLVFILLSALNISLPYDLHHYNYYIGPINDLLNGRTLLVDVFSQYGIGVILFLSAPFHLSLPLTYHGLSFVISALAAIQLILIYFILRKLLSSSVLITAALLFVTLISLFSGNDPYQVLPGIGPLRFLPSMVFLVLTYICKEKKDIGAGWVVLKWLVLGLASLWSFEAFAYSYSIVLAAAFFESFEADKGWLAGINTSCPKSLFP